MENAYVALIRVVVVLAAIVSGMVLLYRYGGKLRLTTKPRTTEYALRKADTIHLGYKKFISVVEVSDRVLVIGVGEKEMSLLTQWQKPENGL
jgi:flagellar biogenesis protein FliO